MVVHLYLFPAAMFLSASLFALAHNVLESALKKEIEKAEGALLCGGVQLHSRFQSGQNCGMAAHSHPQGVT